MKCYWAVYFFAICYIGSYHITDAVRWKLTIKNANDTLPKLLNLVVCEKANCTAPTVFNSSGIGVYDGFIQIHQANSVEFLDLINAANVRRNITFGYFSIENEKDKINYTKTCAIPCFIPGRYTVSLVSRANKVTTTAVSTILPPTPDPPKNLTELGVKNGTRITPNSKITLHVTYIQRLDNNASDWYYHNTFGRSVSGAIPLALDFINNDTKILKHFFLNFYTFHYKANAWENIDILSRLRNKSVVAYISSEPECARFADMCSAYNRPFFAYRCTDPDFHPRKYATLIQLSAGLDHVMKYIVAFLIENQWQQISIIGDNDTSDFVGNLSDYATNRSIIVNHMAIFEEGNTSFKDIIKNTFPRTRIYVYVSDYTNLHEFLYRLSEEGGAEGEHVVVALVNKVITANDSLLHFAEPNIIGNNETYASFMKRIRPLLLISRRDPSANSGYDKFKKGVRQAYSELPFDQKLPENYDLDYQAFKLYDSITRLATAMSWVISASEDKHDGVEVLKVLRGRPFKSKTGYVNMVTVDGELLENYTTLSLNHNTSLFYEVGHFEVYHGGNGSYYYMFKSYLTTPIDWILSRPLDSPDCGWDNEKCLKAKKNPNIVIYAATGAVLAGLFVIALIATVVSKQRNFEKAIEGLSWKIDLKDLKFVNYELATGSRMGASRLTIGSYGQRYTQTGKFKGHSVSFKIMLKTPEAELTRNDKMEITKIHELSFENVNPFHGLCITNDRLIFVSDYLSRGSLQDILINDDILLNLMFKASLINDVIKGLTYLHGTSVGCHGNLKSSNCVVSSRWTLQITDLGLLRIRGLGYDESESYAYYRNKLWYAPEHLRNHREGNLSMSKQGDVYGLAVIVHEVFTRTGPFGTWEETGVTPLEIIERVIATETPPFRPTAGMNQDIPDYVTTTLKTMWHENPNKRPDLQSIWNTFTPMRKGMKANIIDNMVQIMEIHQNNLETLVSERTVLLFEEKEKAELLLYRMLPRSVAEKLKRGEEVMPESFQCVTIYFSDLVGFTELASESQPMEIVDLLNALYIAFDEVIDQYDVYKVETIGDAYMVVSGLPIRNGDSHTGEIASLSISLLKRANRFVIAHRPTETLKLRIGMNSGPCVAGVVGFTMPRYCLFGDTVNTASRMESNGLGQRIHISQSSREVLLRLTGYQIEERGQVEMKGKGMQTTYWLLDEDSEIRHNRMKTWIAEKKAFEESLDEQERRNRVEALSLAMLNISNRPDARMQNVEQNEAETKKGRAAKLFERFKKGRRDTKIELYPKNKEKRPSYRPDALTVV